MRKILLISNYLYHYRINNYNYFNQQFNRMGFELVVLTNKMQNVKFDVNFNVIEKKPFLLNYLSIIDKIKPSVVISFLCLKDLVIFPVYYYCKYRKIPVIYWGFGINTKTPDALWKNLLYDHLHTMADAVLLYSPNEKRYIQDRNKDKVFVAYNTLNFNDIEYKSGNSKGYLQEKYRIREPFVVLFIGRITKNKKIHLLFEILRGHKDIALVIGGAGLPDEYLRIINSTGNYYYLGEIPYDKKEIGRIFFSADVFCIPGNIGLALVEAFFWGKPVLTLEGRNSPEIFYLKNGYNGYIAGDIKELEQRIIEIYNNPALHRTLSENARKTAENESNIANMFKGFENAVRYVLHQ